MKVIRQELTDALDKAAVGLSAQEVLEQSNCFVFESDAVAAFNDEVMVSCPIHIGVTEAIAVSAKDMMAMLARFPDDAVDIQRKGPDLVIKGARKAAGIACESEITLPLAQVPRPKKWRAIDEHGFELIQQAARSCGKDLTQYLTTCVHITPDYIEACDNFRLFRATHACGIQKELLVPAQAIHAIHGLSPTHVTTKSGWLHLKGDEFTAAIRCTHEKYHDDIDGLLGSMKGRKVKLPSNLREMLNRAEVMQDAGHDTRVTITIGGGKLRIESRKDSGWYRETKKVAYTGPEIAFEVNPQFMHDILKLTRRVTITNDMKQMQIAVDDIQFVVSLIAKGTDED